MGSLNALGIRLEEARGLLEELRVLHQNDDVASGKLNSEYSDDIVIRLAHARKEMAFDYEGSKRSLSLMDFMWATDFLDHMDTLGLTITAKPWKK